MDYDDNGFLIGPQVDRDERQFTTFDEAAAKCEGYLDKQHQYLVVQPRFEQKSEQWHIERHGAITASQFGAACKQCDWKNQIDIFICKGGTKDNTEFNNEVKSRMAHGVKFEDTAAYHFEKESRRWIVDYGLLTHHRLWAMRPAEITPVEWHRILHASKKHEALTDEDWDTIRSLRFLKGSPDGITADGAVIEIKCPAGHINNGVIKKGYLFQLMLNMEVSGFNKGYFIQYRPPQNLFKEEYDLTTLQITNDWPSDAEKPEVALIPKFLETYNKKNGEIIEAFADKHRFLNAYILDRTILIPEDWFEPYRLQAKELWDLILDFRMTLQIPDVFKKKVQIESRERGNIVLSKIVAKRTYSGSKRSPSDNYGDFHHMDEEWNMDSPPRKRSPSVTKASSKPEISQHAIAMDFSKSDDEDEI